MLLGCGRDACPAGMAAAGLPCVAGGWLVLEECDQAQRAGWKLVHEDSIRYGEPALLPAPRSFTYEL